MRRIPCTKRGPLGFTLSATKSHRETAMVGSPSNLETRYDVVLVSAGTRPRSVARTIASFTDLRREEAWELLRRDPELILQGASYATAELRAYDVEVPEPAPNSSEPLRGSQAVLITVAIIVLVAFIVLMVFLRAWLRA